MCVNSRDASPPGSGRLDDVAGGPGVSESLATHAAEQTFDRVAPPDAVV
jgi:hypothetical protein